LIRIVNNSHATDIITNLMIFLRRTTKEMSNILLMLKWHDGFGELMFLPVD